MAGFIERERWKSFLDEFTKGTSFAPHDWKWSERLAHRKRRNTYRLLE